MHAQHAAACKREHKLAIQHTAQLLANTALPPVAVTSEIKETK
jgi:hypothetical protein